MKYISNGSKKEFSFKRNDRQDIQLKVVLNNGKYQVYFPIYKGLDASLGIKTIEKHDLKDFLDFVIFKADIEMKSLLKPALG